MNPCAASVAAQYASHRDGGALRTLPIASLPSILHKGRESAARRRWQRAADEPILRAYAQWVSITINNNGSIPIQLKGLGVWWGKLYANG